MPLLMSPQDPNQPPTQMAPVNQMAPGTVQHPLHALIAPLGPPPPDFTQGQIMGMSPGAQPDISGMSPPPQVNRGMSPLEKQTDFTSKKLEKMEAQDQTPAQGFWGKTGHVLSRIGNIAGDVLAPGEMALIPGTELNRKVEEGRLSRNLQALEGEQSREGLEGAQTAHTQAETSDIPGNDESRRKLEQAQTQETIARTGIIQNPQFTNVDMATYQALTKLGMSPSAALQEIERDKQMALRPPNMEAKTLQLPNGQQVAGKVDSQGNLLLEDGSKAPEGSKLYQQPNYGQMMLPTKTATFIGPDGIPREYQWNEQTQTYDKPLGMSASNAYGHEAAQAGAVERAGNQLISTLEANKQNLGTLGAWVAKHGLNTPIADPTLAGIQSQIASFAALNPAMHGARGAQAMEHFERIIGGLQQNPDATIAAIRGIMQTAGNINPDVGGSGEPQTIRAIDPQGKVHEAPKGTPLPTGWKLQKQ